MISGFVSIAIIGLFGLLLMAGLWIGVVVLAKANRSAAWWLMLAGLCASSLGLLTYITSMGVMLDRYFDAMTTTSGTTSSISPATTGFAVGMGVSALAFVFGILIFNAGFAMQAFKTARLAKRAAELEALCASMAAEINRTSGISVPNQPGF